MTKLISTLSIATVLVFLAACAAGPAPGVGMWGWWKGNGRPRRVNPRFRAVFLTKTAERAEHIAALAAAVARNRDRLVCYSATQDAFLSDPDALRSPIFIDHQGRWQSLVNLHPSSRTMRTPIRLAVCWFASVFVC